LGFRGKPKLARVGKSIVCFAFLLLNFYYFYGDAYRHLNYTGNISAVWGWLPLVIGIGVLALCLLKIWKPFDGKKLRASALCLAGALVVLTVVAALAGTYRESFFVDLVDFVNWYAHIALAVAAFIVYFCFRKENIVVRIGISALCAIPFGFAWLGVLLTADEIRIGVIRYEADPDIFFYLQPAIICIGGFFICLLFVWKAFDIKARVMTAACILGALIISNVALIELKAYDGSLTFFSVPGEVEEEWQGRDISLVEYEPFRENTLAKSLDEQSTLRLHDNLPRLEGATALYPLYAAFARAVYPEDDYPAYSDKNYFQDNINPVITCSMTSGAFEMLIDGEADVIFLMGVSEEQREMALERGLELKLTPVGREAFVFFVNKRNSISDLTVEDVKGIYSGRIASWREVGGNNDYIRPFQRAKNSGSQTMLMEIMGDTPLMTVPESDYYDMMYEIYQAVAVYKNYKNALGYSFLFYINEMIAEDEIKLLSIGGVGPTTVNIANGAYPFANDFYAITVNREPETGTEAERIRNAEKLIEWILSPQGQSLVEKTGYVPLR